LKCRGDGTAIGKTKYLKLKEGHLKAIKAP
jgi:hypothetical protein